MIVFLQSGSSNLTKIPIKLIFTRHLKPMLNDINRSFWRILFRSNGKLKKENNIDELIRLQIVKLLWYITFQFLRKCMTIKYNCQNKCTRDRSIKKRLLRDFFGEDWRTYFSSLGSYMYLTSKDICESLISDHILVALGCVTFKSIYFTIISLGLNWQWSTWL